MALCEVHMSSRNTLQRMTSFMAIIPEQNAEPFPVLYLLHGLSDDHTAWIRRTSIERYVENLPLMIVMPSADRSWYTDSVSSPTSAYETFIIRDLIGFVDRSFNTRKNRYGRAIAGLSMGGYGAFKLALKHPDIFCAAASLSGALIVGERFDENEQRHREMHLIFGETVPESEDIWVLAQHVHKGFPMALWMNCGTEDFLIDQNRRMHEHLTALGVPHHYSEHIGTHTWDYWDARIQEALEFLKEALQI